ncbi:restriction endonuclease [Halovenus rubra]|uniref:Restriction endonuclease n=2 Tax=Halovenus rubra TaxID=869890 RepID=A0ACC7E485_9EURY|nr:restriction endonuclease [Halovenus rubra]
MERLINLTESAENTDILTSTTVNGGLLGGDEILATSPLASYLHEEEKPKYALRNKSAGIEIQDGTDTDQITPSDDLQALALVTDLRVLVVVGQQDGDIKLEVPLSDVVEAKTEEKRFRTSVLVITTLSGERWEFPSKTDSEPFATTVDEFAQLWTHSYRLLDEAAQQVESVKDAVERGDVDDARERVDIIEDKIENAKTHISEVGLAAKQRVKTRAEKISNRLVDTRRELSAAEGALAHARAQQKWREESYESAARRFEETIKAYQRALSTHGQTPPDDVLRMRLKGAATERELLRVSPLVDADTERRRAINEPDPEKAATAWKCALDNYRELLTLDWGKETRNFLVDRDTIRDQTVSIADDAIEDHLAAGEQWLESGDRLAVGGHDQQAREVYGRAQTQFQNANELAKEVRPEQLDQIRDAMATVEERLSGDVPDEVPTNSTLDTVDISAPDGMSNSQQRAVDESDSTDQGQQSSSGRDEVDNHDRNNPELVTELESPDPALPAEESTASQQDPDETETESEKSESHASEAEAETGSVPSGTDNSGKSVLDQIRSSKQTEEKKTENEHAGSVTDDSTLNQPAQTTGSTDRAAETNDASHNVGDKQETHSGQSSTVETKLAMLSEAQFKTLVSELWEAQGWSTVPESAQAASAFDVLALRERPREERLGIWTVHRPQDTVDTEDVVDCRMALAESQGAESATIVTTAEVSEKVKQDAEERDFAVVGRSDLTQLLRFEDLVDRLDRFATG